MVPSHGQRNSRESLPISGPALAKPAQKKLRQKAKDAAPSLSERIQAERDRIFKAISLVECCKYASATMLDVQSSEYIEGVYELLVDVLDCSRTLSVRLAAWSTKAVSFSLLAK